MKYCIFPLRKTQATSYLFYTITPNVKANKEGEKGDTLHDFGGRHKTQARKEKNSNWSLTELKISAFQRIP